MNEENYSAPPSPKPSLLESDNYSTPPSPTLVRFFDAVQYSNAEELSKFPDSYINSFDAFGDTLLIKALKSRKFENAEYLIKKEVTNVTLRCDSGNPNAASAIHYACLVSAPTKIINLLIERGAKVEEEFTDQSGNKLTPINLTLNEDIRKILRSKSNNLPSTKSLSPSSSERLAGTSLVHEF